MVGVWQRATSPITLTTTTETVVATIVTHSSYNQPIPPDPPTFVATAIPVPFFAYCNVTTGASTNTLTTRIRRGTTTGGTLIGNAQVVTAPASNTVAAMVGAVDDSNTANPGAGTSYVFTIQQGAATTNGTVNFALFLSSDAVGTWA